MTNPEVRALIRGTRGNRYQVKAPGAVTFRPRGRAGTSTPDLLVTDYRSDIVQVLGEGCWMDLYDNTPVIRTVGTEAEREREGIRRGRRV